MPAISSIRSRYTGKRDRPVARVRLTTSSAVAEAWRALTRTRGGHDVLCGQLAQGQGADEEVRRVLFQGARAGRVAGQ